jgi:site-specific DNA recombinase
MVKAAIYARISSDDGTALGVARQVEDCKRLAAELGWEVAEVYVDNDVSAYSGKKRPAYERMVADLRDGYRDGVVVYHLDRLTRRPIELEQFLEVLTEAKVTNLRFVASGGMDVGTGDGLLVARMLAAVAAAESETKSRRVRRKMDEVAAAGRPHGGAPAFGFERDKVTHNPAQAETIRRIADRYIAGESWRSIAQWLDDEGVRTVAGGPWTTTTLRSLLKSGRIAGLREHRGEVIGPAVWEPIITIEQREKILARMADAATNRRRTPRRYLLSGMLRCGRCGNRLYSSPRKNRRRYVCLSGPDHGGCGHLTIVAPPVEELVTAAVLYRLDTPELAQALEGRTAEDTEAAALAEILAADQAQLDELAKLYADKAIGVREWMAARGPIEDRINDTRRRIARLTRTDALAGFVGNGSDLKAAWSDLNLTRQAAIVKTIVDHVVIAPGTKGANEVDPGRVEIVWGL